MSKHEKIVRGERLGDFRSGSEKMSFPTLAIIGALTTVIVKLLIDRSKHQRPQISSNINRHPSLSSSFPSVTGNRRHR